VIRSGGSLPSSRDTGTRTRSTWPQTRHATRNTLSHGMRAVIGRLSLTSGQQDLNLRPPRPQRGALTKLSHVPDGAWAVWPHSLGTCTILPSVFAPSCYGHAATASLAIPDRTGVSPCEGGRATCLLPRNRVPNAAVTPPARLGARTNPPLAQGLRGCQNPTQPGSGWQDLNLRPHPSEGRALNQAAPHPVGLSVARSALSRLSFSSPAASADVRKTRHLPSGLKGPPKPHRGVTGTRTPGPPACHAGALPAEL
jgi:hypothetical protein